MIAVILCGIIVIEITKHITNDLVNNPIKYDIKEENDDKTTNLTNTIFGSIALILKTLLEMLWFYNIFFVGICYTMCSASLCLLNMTYHNIQLTLKLLDVFGSTYNNTSSYNDIMNELSYEIIMTNSGIIKQIQSLKTRPQTEMEHYLMIYFTIFCPIVITTCFIIYIVYDIKKRYIPIVPNNINTQFVAYNVHMPQKSTDNTTEDATKSCRICYANIIKTVCVPCGHIIMCNNCARTLIEKNGLDTKCPACTQDVEGIYNVFA